VSVASHVGREAEIVALGRTWRASRWTRAVWADFLAWAKGRIPDPLDILLSSLDRIPEHLQDAAVRYAIDKSSEHLSVASPVVMRCLDSVEGTAHLLYLLLKPNHPGLTEDEAFEIALAAPEQAKAAFDRASGRFVEGPAKNGEGPAAEPTGRETTGPSARLTA
jgi:hypothetical protein